ncbi:MAG: bZIP transcription factor [Gammaproteobacteria bacterium]|nr:bZIP transcription factor [Gammaproteobacteria bacterium]
MPKEKKFKYKEKHEQRRIQNALSARRARIKKEKERQEMMRALQDMQTEKTALTNEINLLKNRNEILKNENAELLNTIVQQSVSVKQDVLSSSPYSFFMHNSVVSEAHLNSQSPEPETFNPVRYDGFLNFGD